ncbi:hypothetical protein Emag_004104 [Eimeria magna]
MSQRGRLSGVRGLWRGERGRKTGSSTVDTLLTAAATAAAAAAAAAAGDVKIMGFMRKHVLLLQRQQQQHCRRWARLLLLLLLFIAATAAADGGQTSKDLSTSKSAASARPEAVGKPAAATAAAATATAATAAASLPSESGKAKSDRTFAPSSLNTEAIDQSSAAAGAAAAAAGAAAEGAGAAAEAGEAAGAAGGTGRIASAEIDGAGVLGIQGEGQDEVTEEGDRQTMGLGGPGSLFARTRPVFAPFIRHYSKYMAILWEWYTKTIGATMNGRRRQDEDALVVHAPALWQPNVRFKAVFDGHGGPSVSRTCVAQFCNFYGF